MYKLLFSLGQYFQCAFFCLIWVYASIPRYVHVSTVTYQLCSCVNCDLSSHVKILGITWIKCIQRCYFCIVLECFILRVIHYNNNYIIYNFPVALCNIISAITLVIYHLDKDNILHKLHPEISNPCLFRQVTCLCQHSCTCWSPCIFPFMTHAVRGVWPKQVPQPPRCEGQEERALLVLVGSRG